MGKFIYVISKIGVSFILPILISVLAIVISVLSSCTKEGAPGTPGTNGNANVHTHTYTGSWIKTGSEYDLTINDPDITQDIINNGSVEAFYTLDNGTSWTSIPLTIGSVTIVYTYAVGRITIASTGGSSAPTPVLWKIVTIAGN